MPRNKLLSALLLWPLSKLFGAGVAVRNMLYDRGVLKSRSMDVPVVVVGNLAVGGTGKTPHVEYLLEALRTRHHVAVLSRGYKRHTKGYVSASPTSSPDDIGDEAWQVNNKFGPEVRVAVCENRCEGVDALRRQYPDIDLVVLDDAFQHRQLKPTASVVLTEYSRPAYCDSMLPYGRLREPVTALNRADIVVVTKCPANIKPMEIRMFRENLNLMAWQQVYFSRYVYGHLVPVFPHSDATIPWLDRLTHDDSLLVVTGIANPRPFVRYLRRYEAKVRLSCFPDHHSFTHADIAAIRQKLDTMSGERKYIVTTEKDAVRLSHNPYFPPELKPLTFFLPVSVSFIDAASPGEPPFEVAVGKLIDRAKR